MVVSSMASEYKNNNKLLLGADLLRLTKRLNHFLLLEPVIIRRRHRCCNYYIINSLVNAYNQLCLEIQFNIYIIIVLVNLGCLYDGKFTYLIRINKYIVRIDIVVKSLKVNNIYKSQSVQKHFT